MKALKKALVALLGAVLGCCFFVGCLSTKISVTYVVDGETYRVQEYEMDTQVSLPTPPTKEGHTFIGWYTDEALTVPYAEGTITAGLTLYAKFSVSTVYIVVNTAGGEKIEAIEVVPGGDYTIPEAVKEGHTFLGYIYVDENGDEQEFPLTGKYPSNVGIKITAKYSVNKYTVTFSGVEEQEVAYGSVAVAPNADRAGYTFDGWYTSETEQTEDTKFDFTTAITDDITLYAKYTAKTFTITVNGAQQGYANPTVQFGDKYSLATPDRGANYEFVKFTMNGQDFAAEGVYTWTEDIAIDVVWDGVGKDVMFFDGANELPALRIETEYGADVTALRLPAVPAKTGYSTDGKWYTDAACTQEFVAEGTVETDIRLYAKYTANEYVVTFMVWDKATKATKLVPVTVTYGNVIDVPARAERDAYNFDGYFYNDAIFDTSKAYTLTTNITVEERWTLRDDASLFVDYDKNAQQFLERENYDADWTYVYLVGVKYTLASAAQLSMVTAGGEQYAEVAGNALTIKAPGTFTIQINNADGSTTFRTIKALDPIRSFEFGTSYDAAWGVANGEYKRNSTDVWDKQVAVSAGEVMQVGAKNFIPEISIDGSINNFDSTSVNVSVVVEGKETTDYTVANGAINFGASLVGKKVTVSLKPKYNIQNFEVVYEVMVNNAMNVYTNEDMKAAFADKTIAEINVLRNIAVALSDDQVIKFTLSDGWGERISPKNYSDIDGATGVYTRREGSLKINGNYFTIDASKVPLVDARHGQESELVVNPDLSTYSLVDTRFAIFLFGTRNQASDYTYEMSNLNIINNGDMDAAKGYTWNERTVLENSGAAIGVEIGSGYLNMNNVTSRLGSFGVLISTGGTPVYDNRHTAIITATDCKLEKNWANNAYINGFVSATFDSCYIGVANGAAIHFDVKPSPKAIDGEINLTNGTDIQNWVTGQEAWFKAQGATAAVPMIKDMVEPGVQAATQGTKSIMKTVGGEEKTNFAIVMRAREDTVAWSQEDKRGANWMADIEDANYRGYLQQEYMGQGAMAFGGKVLDIVYLGFMQEMAKMGAYTPAQINAYAMANYDAKYVRASTDKLGDYMEIYVEMV